MNLKSYLRFIGRNKLYTLIEVVGMAVAIAFVLFIGSFLLDELTKDSAIRKQGDIYVGRSETLYLGTVPRKEKLEGIFPSVRSMCNVVSTFYMGGVPLEVRVGDGMERQNALMTDPEFFEMFPFPLLEGSAKDVLQDRYSLVLSRSFARRVFGDRSPMGERMDIAVDGKIRGLMVTGVFEDFHNTVFHAPDMIYNIEVIKELHPSLVGDGNGVGALCFRLEEGTDVATLEKQIEKVLKEQDALYRLGLSKEFHLIPFSKVGREEIDTVLPFENTVKESFVRLFVAAGILLLVFALLNYIALTVAQSGFRAKEMATRRLLGSQQGAIRRQYLLESFLLTSVSFLAALVLCKLFSPSLSLLVGKTVSPLGNLGLLHLGFMFLLLLLLSLCSGLVPALLVSRFQPIDVVRGSFSRVSKMTLGKVLITLQSLFAVFTLSLSIVMFFQLRYMMSEPRGYEKEGRIGISGANKVSDYHVEELRNLACVERVGWLHSSPVVSSTQLITFTKGDENLRINMFRGDQTAFEILGFKVIRQNADAIAPALWVTESARLGLGLDYDATRLDVDAGYIPVCGFIGDFHKGSGDKSAKQEFPLCAWIMDVESDAGFGVLRELVVKVRGDEKDAVKQIRAFYQGKGLGEDELKVATYSQLMMENFASESRNLKLIGLFTALVLLLVSLALLAISTYYARQHSRDVSIRKVMGCSRNALFGRTVWNFLRYVCLAIVIAVPVSWLVSSYWLESYAYRISHTWWMFLLASLVIGVLAVGSVSWQTLRLMKADPVRYLKRE